MNFFEQYFTSEGELIAGSLLLRGQQVDLQEMLSILKKKEYITYVSEFEHMSIDNVRTFQESFQRKHKGRRVIVIACDAITHDAQHALLKTIEDRSPQDACILVVPPHAMLLPTILSRMTVLAIKSERPSVIDEWLNMPTPTAKRKVLVMRCGDEKNENARENLIDFLEHIQSQSKNIELRKHILTTIHLARKSGTSVKQLYDYFCGNFSL